MKYFHSGTRLFFLTKVSKKWWGECWSFSTFLYTFPTPVMIDGLNPKKTDPLFSAWQSASIQFIRWIQMASLSLTDPTSLRRAQRIKTIHRDQILQEPLRYYNPMTPQMGDFRIFIVNFMYKIANMLIWEVKMIFK